MELSHFLHDIADHGHILLPYEPVEFTAEDIQRSEEKLRQLFDWQTASMPVHNFVFQPDAAIWSARFILYAIQLMGNREIGEERLPELLPSFSGTITTDSILSVDIVMQYLPELFHLANGLSPSDKLLSYLMDSSRAWPFSSVGIEIPDLIHPSALLNNESLCLTYADRIILKKDINRALHPQILPWIQTVLGNHGEILWPEFSLHLKTRYELT